MIGQKDFWKINQTKYGVLVETEHCNTFFRKFFFTRQKNYPKTRISIKSYALQFPTFSSLRNVRRIQALRQVSEQWVRLNCLSTQISIKKNIIEIIIDVMDNDINNFYFYH